MRIISAALLVVFTVSSIYSQNKYQKPLSGLPGVVIGISGGFDGLAKDGFDPQQIQTDIELRLRKAGIKILSKEDDTERHRQPRLYVFVTAVKFNSNYYACHIEVEVKEDATVDRNSRRSAATSWGRGTLVVVTDGNLRRVRDEIGDYVDAFANDYLAANPR